MNKRAYSLFFFGLLISAVVAANAKPSEPLRIRYFQTDHRYHYRISLLTLALEKTRVQYGDYILQPYPLEVTQGRGEKLLASKAIDVAFFPSSQERESKFRSVRFPLLQGILGIRVLMTRQSLLPLFAQVNQFVKFKQDFVAGFGSHWADKPLLERNGLSVYGVSLYPTLFPMLAKGRFDYIPRGINEAWRELKKFGPVHPELAIDQSLLLYYPAPVFFFTHRSDHHLHQRLLLGLRTAEKDGSFAKLFELHNQKFIEQAQLDQRRVFKLSNPNLPKDIDLLSLERFLPH